MKSASIELSKIVTLVLSITFSVFGQDIARLPDRWNFINADDPRFSIVDFPDSMWNKIEVPSAWENQGYPDLDGFAWYRVSFDVAKEKNDICYLLLGKIDDADETYLNGVKIGSGGTFPPQPSSEWNVQRVYTIPKGLLKKKNILAVRVYDSGGPGGIQKGIFGVFSKNALQKLTAESGKEGKSYFQLTTSNGLIAAVYDTKKNEIAAAYPHIFKAVDESQGVKPFVTNIRLNTSEAPKTVSYLRNSHVIQASYKEVKVSYFAPFVDDSPVLCIMHERNVKSAAPNLTFSRTDTPLIFDSLVLYVDEKINTYYFFTIEDPLYPSRQIIEYIKERFSFSKNAVDDEVAFMQSVFKRCKIPKGLTAAERALFEQSISMMKMAQVSQREVYPKGRGQVLASLPPGQWNICWLRDACYTLLAFTRLGMYDEAKNLIRFFLNADAGFYKKYVHTDKKDYGVGQDYQLSVCRYYGAGKEESDFNDAGPNIELDGYGLFLYAYSNYVKVSGDTAIWHEYRRTVKVKIADVLLAVIDANGLVRKDSGPWERHLPCAQYAYTSITAAKGLMDYGALLNAFGTVESTKYKAGGAALLSALQKNLITPEGIVKAKAEAISISQHEYLDAATYELFNFFPREFRRIFPLHHNFYKKQLQLSPERGFRRVNLGDWYDAQEWVFLDCRIINALLENNQQKEAKRLRDRLTVIAARHWNQIPELLEEKTGAYEGAIPMIGFGAASYILTWYSAN